MLRSTGIFLFWLAVTIQVALADQPDAILLKKITNYSIENSKLKEKNSITIQINNRSGEKYSTVKIPYSEDNPIKNFDISLTDLNGQPIRKIKKSEIVDISAFASYSFYEDEYLKTIDIKHNQFPYLISCSYEVQYDQFFQIANWSPILDTNIPTIKAELNLQVSQDYQFRYKHSGSIDFSERITEGKKKLTWATQYLEPIKEEIYSPPLQTYLPNVQIVPLEFEYGVTGSMKDWVSFGDWVYRLNEGMDELPPYEKQKINDAIKSCPDQKSKVKKLYEYLQQNTRYVNISLGIGGLQCYPAEYVSRNKYGDCKALTNYLKSALKYIGITSYYALINAGKNQEWIDLDFPAQQFNHVILYVPLKDEEIWLECTDNTAPFNYLGSFTQNRNALIIDNGNSRFIKTPAINTSETYDLVKTSLRIKEDFTLDIKTDYFFKATDYFEMYSYLQHQGGQRDLERYVDELSDFPNSHTISRNVEKNSLAPDGIMINVLSEQKQPLRKYGNEILFDTPSLSLPSFETPGKRTLPVRIDYPIHKIDTMVIHLSNGSKTTEIPDRIELKSDFGYYLFSVAHDSTENEYQYVKEFSLNPGFYELSDYKSFYDFLEEVKRKENRKLFFSLKD